MQWFGTTYTRRFNKELILSQIQGNNKHRQSREKSQKYSKEHRRIWEDVHHGFLYGSRKFVKRIKDRYMVNEPDPAIPQQKSIKKDSDPADLLRKASKLLKCDLETIRNSPRVSESEKLNRDILLYLLWQEGKYTNIQIGNLLGLAHSAVCRRVTIIRKKMALEQNFQSQIEAIKSQIKP